MVGGFSKVLLTIKGHLEYKTFCLFYVDNVNQLSRSQEPVIDYPYVIKHKIMVIGYVDRKWYIDPLIEDIRSHWMYWLNNLCSY